MEQFENEELLTKANNYFLQDKFGMFLDEFSKCYAYNTDCFNDEINVFKFSLSRYAQTNNSTVNEFNRFIIYLDKYLNTLDGLNAREFFIVKIKNLIDKKYNEVCLYDKVIYFENFNNYCAILMQLYQLLSKVITNKLIDDENIINDFILDIEGKIKQLQNIIKFTGSRYKVHFIYLPKKPKEFLKGLEADLADLKKSI